MKGSMSHTVTQLIFNYELFFSFLYKSNEDIGCNFWTTNIVLMYVDKECETQQRKAGWQSQSTQGDEGHTMQGNSNKLQHVP